MSRAVGALVIGNASYDDFVSLRNPTNDANDIADKLEKYRISVTRLLDSNHTEIAQALDNFPQQLGDKEVGIFFFAGHGIQIGGVNYLIAKDSRFTNEASVKHTAISLDYVIDIMEGSSTTTNVIILDACRDNPWDRPWMATRSAITRGLAPVSAPRGTIIAFATSPGQFAGDGSGRNGAYTEALLQHIDMPDCSIENMFKKVRNTLSANTRGRQISWEHTSLAGDFFINLSLGVRIKDYSDSVLRDGSFVIDSSKPAHQVVRALKFTSWYSQNPAIDQLKASDANTYTEDNLFLIGRNIYQAACGTANSAIGFIINFVRKTEDYIASKRKAVLDGMLFEIFFDKQGNFRDDFKGDRFNSVFELQKYANLEDSFNFISDCLVEYSDKFYQIPGKKWRVSVQVVNFEKDGKFYIQSVFLSGQNILKVNDQDWLDADQNPTKYFSYDEDDLKITLSEQMVIPVNLLDVAYSPINLPVGVIRFPYGHTCCKI